MDQPPEIDDDYDSLFEKTMAGHLLVSPEGLILRANGRLASWLGEKPETLVGRRFSDLLTIGGKIYLETHLSPMLRMQGEFEEVMLEMKASSGSKLPVLVNGFEERDQNEQPRFTRITVIRALDRMTYEQNLRQVGRQARESLAALEGHLLDERETAALREQFIAVLGHDLRNPLAAIDAGIRAIAKSPLDERQSRILPLLQASVLRMAGLIDDVMDLARGRLGGGIPVKLQQTDLAPILQQVIDELAGAHPEGRIEVDLQLPVPVSCDGPRIAQLASNLLANAITHGSGEEPVKLSASSDGTGFTLKVENAGEPIPAEAVERLFQPFTRAANDGKQGLGLGLYIASEIARAHGGSLTVSSDKQRTVFTLSV
jgi:phosphoserine phosphatase RsbU/P